MRQRAYKFASAMKRTLFAASLLFTAGSFAQSPPAPMVSPEVHGDHLVTFRFRAPNAKEVALVLQGAVQDQPIQKDAQSVWRITTDPLSPDFYGYPLVA